MESPSARTLVESSISRPQNLQCRRGVRVVGKIRPSLDGEAGSFSSDRPLISVVKLDGGHALISFADQAASRNESYELDWCYEQDDSVSEIFSKEVKPFLEGLFCGKNACVMAYGSRRSGKTQLIQGSEETPGLALMAIREILSFVEKREGSVSMSCYEVKEDHLYDILEPKGHEVQVLEDAGRRIQLKGLSQVPVKSDSDFKRIYFHECHKGKVPTNVAPLRSHKGLIIYVSVVDKQINASHLGKICFLDLAGYEDAQPKSNPRLHLTENAKVNKSLFQLLNVVYALNASENYVPYRESKLTRLLQEFLGKASEAVMITCLSTNLNQSTTVHVARMASRSCQVVNQRRHDPFGKHKNSLRHTVLSSHSNGKTNSLDYSINKCGSPNFGSIKRRGNGTTPVMKGRNQLLCSSTNKVGISLPGSIGKERNDTPILIKGRKLIEDRSPTSYSMQEGDLPEKQAIEDEALIVSAAIEPHLVKDSIEDASKELGLSKAILDHSSAIEQSNSQSINPRVSCETQNYKAEDHASQLSTEVSPPLSERIREISNSLKLLSSQPLSISTPQSEALCARKINMHNRNPETPAVPFNLSLDENATFDNTCTPQDRFKTRSTGLKRSLVQECLAFLNSANKEELKELKGIGEKRASYILELREDNAEPFKTVDDLKVLGLSSRQINEMMRSTIGDF